MTSPPPADEVTVIRAHLDGSTPGLYAYALVRQSFAALLLDGAAAFADEVDRPRPRRGAPGPYRRHRRAPPRPDAAHGPSPRRPVARLVSSRPAWPGAPVMGCPGPAVPDAAMQRAILLAARCLLDASPEAAEAAHGWAVTSAEDCPGCAVVASLQLGFAIAAGLDGDDLVTGPLLARLTAMVEAARAELDGAAN